ncbi:MAG: DUF1993 domain-containing protein [Deltaproteobacteria bacterium]|jgi:hypothetical protein|nr:DUF1993 domain-containing protein [Deltaproteobacteria bacterium]
MSQSASIDAAVFQFCTKQQVRILKNLQSILKKSAEFADHKKINMEVLLQARLAPDQFPLMRQIQIACDTAKFNCARFTGTTAPSHPDDEKTLTEAMSRIDSVVQYLASFKEADFSGSSQRKITNPRWESKWMTGEDFFHQYAAPNVYFHVTTAYSILRHNGVEIGKSAYLGDLSFQ